MLVVTDGEPTAHIEPDGEAVFSYPPLPQTIRATIAQVDDLTRMRALMSVVMLGDDPGLERFVNAMVRRNGGRVLSPSIDRLGDYVVNDYLAARQRRR